MIQLEFVFASESPIPITVTILNCFRYYQSKEKNFPMLTATVPKSKIQRKEKKSKHREKYCFILCDFTIRNVSKISRVIMIHEIRYKEIKKLNLNYYDFFGSFDRPYRSRIFVRCIQLSAETRARYTRETKRTISVRNGETRRNETKRSFRIQFSNLIGNYEQHKTIVFGSIV